jgi:hemolysin activation/secretion protein
MRIKAIVARDRRAAIFVAAALCLMTSVSVAIAPAMAWAQSKPNGGAGGTVENTLERARSVLRPEEPSVSRAKTPDWYSPPPIDAATSTVTFPLKTVKIQGVTALPHDKVEALIAPFRGKTVSLADLQGVADKVTKLYADYGYGLSFAVVPEQDVENGVVRLVAIEVYIDKITVEMTQRSASFIGPGRIRKLLEKQADVLKEERPVKVEHIERMLLTLNELAGVKATVTVKRGVRGQGAARMALDIVATGMAVNASSDNRLRSDFGRTEYAIEGAFRSIGVVGDELALSGAKSARDGDFSFWSARYQAPLFGSPTKGFLSFSRSNSRPSLGGLGAADFQGVESAFHFGVVTPIFLHRTSNLKLRLEGVAVDSSSAFLGSKIVSNKTRVFDVDLAYDLADRFGGIDQAELTLEQGVNGLGAIRQRNKNALPAISPIDATADNLVVRARFGRSQPVFGFNTQVNVDGQAVMYGVLPSPSNCTYGGPASGVGFDVAALAADECVRAGLRIDRFIGLGRGVYISPYLTADAGWLWHLGGSTTAGHSYVTAQSVGLGFDLGFKNNIVLDAMFTLPVTNDTTRQYSKNPKTLVTTSVQTLVDTSPSVYFNLGLRR